MIIIHYLCSHETKIGPSVAGVVGRRRAIALANTPSVIDSDESTFSQQLKHIVNNLASHCFRRTLF